MGGCVVVLAEKLFQMVDVAESLLYICPVDIVLFSVWVRLHRVEGYFVFVAKLLKNLFFFSPLLGFLLLPCGLLLRLRGHRCVWEGG